jgi:hypothetical protein
VPHERETLTLGSTGEPAVLEDPTGRRARLLRRTGRAVFVLFLAWLAAILLGGLGLEPVPHVPFARTLRPSQGPPPAPLPAPRQPSASDLLPAAPAPVAVRKAHGRAAGSAAPGNSGSAPGRTKLRPGRAHPARGKSGVAPGRVERRTTTTVTNPTGKPRGHGRR